MHCGGICFIDEIGKIRPRALALLVSVLDERRYIDSTVLGERVHAHPGFRFVAATNTGEVNSLPEFVRSRLRPVIEVGFPPQQEINEIIARHIPSEQNIAALLDVFWGLWAGAKRPPTPRDAIHQLALASSLGDFDRIGPINESNGDQSPLERQNSAAISGSVKTEHLREAFKQLFAQGLE
jgi:MoxR-like ATPase